ncbi:MAG: lysophospholipid acyltransferase family protein, partial [Coriobacteriia bacterium]
FTPEQIEKASVEEINRRLNETFKYDEYAWQKENNIVIDHPNRAKGLHHILYQCPHCLTESRMNSDKDEIWCEHCHKRWKMNELGELSAVEGATEYSHIPDWFEFERIMVRKQIEDGTYFFMDKVTIDSLPNAKGYINLGEATLTHSIDGFVLEKFTDNEHFRLEKKPLSLYSLHIEFDYFGKGDCLDLSTLEDTFYLYPLTRKNVVTKLQFAVEEIYKMKEKERVASRANLARTIPESALAEERA